VVLVSEELDSHKGEAVEIHTNGLWQPLWWGVNFCEMYLRGGKSKISSQSSFTEFMISLLQKKIHLFMLQKQMD